MNEKELQSIKSLEDELREAQEIEFLIKSSDGRNPVQKIVNAYAVKESLYTDKKELSKMIDTLKDVLTRYIKAANIKGHLYGKKGLESYLEKSELRVLSERKLRLINMANERQAKKRLSVSFLEIEKEGSILSADIKIFIERAKIAGFNEKESLRQLVIAAKDKDGIAQGFANRIKSVNVAAVRREQAAAKIAEYEKNVDAKEKWQWITVSAKPCPDCEARAGRVMYLSEWQRLGIPGSGRTICGAYCKCQLIPFNIAEDQFPTVKIFDWDNKDLVLTTASEARQLRAFKNQAIQRTKK